ncbi:MAG: hypothetical protein SOU49_07380 [Sodaliphilus pleomorphus]|uniref:hypothetical protein n=1 Tax=Sodaliphilus pleomorphus TaxID=2606626 RepID=UPI0023F4D2B9|nr:hypothetical protein [Sodaliphilus pleomorphus]MDD7065986.1 hypothetical protein [Sodaliphilus pleomorphus]MDY2832546.1 hypothetical protein [Sodaliphilus pleomorphus]
MDASYAQLLSRVYELEGLLLLAEKKGEATPGKVIDLIKDKARAIDTAAQQLTPGAADQATSGNDLPCNDYDPDETWQHDNGEEPGEIFGSGIAYVEPQHMPAEPVAEQHPAPVAGNDDDEPEPPAFTPANIDMTGGENSDNDIDIDDDDEEENPVRLDEQLQRNLSKNMRKALSLNDRYRFKRELFGNSELDLNDALDMVQSMKSYDEATDYFYGDLGWDKDNDEVQDFMSIVKKHFL